MFWNIGKNVFEHQNFLDNATNKYSNYFQYKFGMTECFSRENVNLMRKLYLCFPIFNDNLLKLDAVWNPRVDLRCPFVPSGR